MDKETKSNIISVFTIMFLLAFIASFGIFIIDYCNTSATWVALKTYEKSGVVCFLSCIGLGTMLCIKD